MSVSPLSGDHAEYRFLTASQASVDCRLALPREQPELQLFGNRAGLLSLANVLLWFIANAGRREFLSLAELDFIRLAGLISVSIRLTDGAPSGHCAVRRLDRGELLESAITEEGLRQVALGMHRLMSVPEHEYDRLMVADESEFGIHIRMTDVVRWLESGRG